MSISRHNFLKQAGAISLGFSGLQLIMNGSELAGATFSPDGSTLFFNIQKAGLTLAVTGHWKTAGS